MNFLEAMRTSPPHGAPTLSFTVAMSGTGEQLDVFLKAHAALRGLAARPSHIPFGTLAQHLLSQADPLVPELIVLVPWDLTPRCDWRLGPGGIDATLDDLLDEGRAFMGMVNRRPNARLLYLPAPLPVILPARRDNLRLPTELAALAASHGAAPLPAEAFSMSSYLASGCPLGGPSLDGVAATAIDILLARPAGSSKVLVSDADETLWSGIVGEDGPDGVSANPSGAGFKHFVYQTAMKRMKSWGVLLTIVSRNDGDLLRAPFADGRFPLTEADFVAMKTGYGRKSDLITELARELNLGLDSFVFVDDNPVELAEVAGALAEVTCLAFPKADHDLPEFLARLGALFDRGPVTEEDVRRTDFYRRSLTSTPRPDDNLGEFLRGQQMVLTIHDRSRENNERAIQLINKTNQFNLNGLRLTREELDEYLADGARLLTAELSDRSGGHGEILACLIDSSGCVRALVMSCRVLQRTVEDAFVSWLVEKVGGGRLILIYRRTERNQPLRQFLEKLVPGARDGQVELTAAALEQATPSKESLMTIVDASHD